MSEETEQHAEEYEEVQQEIVEDRYEEPTHIVKKVETVYIENSTPQEDSEDKEYKDRMVIRSYSSMILFIPSFIAALTCGITQMLLNRYRDVPLEDAVRSSGYMDVIGIIFLVIFSLNLILIAFDFSRARTIIIIVLIIAIIAILLLVNAYTGFLSGGDPGAEQRPMRIYFSTQVYLGLAALLLFIISFTLLGSLFNYYVVEGNELLHYRGIGGGVERYPATNMSIVKEYPDIIEFLFFRSGTLILTPPRATRSIIMKNVIGIDKKERTMNEILARLKVDID